MKCMMGVLCAPLALDDTAHAINVRVDRRLSIKEKSRQSIGVSVIDSTTDQLCRPRRLLIHTFFPMNIMKINVVCGSS